MWPHSCACSVAPWGHCCLLASLKTWQNSRTCSGDCGRVWHGQSSVCASPAQVPRLWSCLAWTVFVQYGTALVMYPDCLAWAVSSHVPRLWSCLAWTVFVQYGPALVMYPDCLAWAVSSHVPRLWFCLAWAVSSHVPRLWSCLSGMGSL